MLELVKAGPPPGLNPAGWLVAEAERLERVHYAIERERERLRAHAQILIGEAQALKAEHSKVQRELEYLVERKSAHKKKFEAEYAEPLDRLWEQRQANNWARVDLLGDAGRYSASKAVQDVFRHHEKSRKAQARLKRAEHKRRGARRTKQENYPNAG